MSYFNIKRIKQTHPELGLATKLVDHLSNLQILNIIQGRNGPTFLRLHTAPFVEVVFFILTPQKSKRERELQTNSTHEH